MPPRCETLKNGLRVVLVPCEAESVAVGLFVASGSRHEPAEQSGISHFIEHMLFKGTPTRSPLDITRAIEGRGGNFNACTDEEMTCYYAHLPSEYLDEAVDILGDMYAHASMPADEFRREKQVVIEEIKMYHDEPDSLAMENLQAALFPGHPLGRPVAGTPETLGPMKPIDLKRYVKSHYIPSRTIAVIVGAFDEAAALRIIEKSLGGEASGTRSASGARSSSLSRPSRPIVVEKPALNQTQIALGYRTFGVGDARKYAATVMDAILGRGMSSRLFQEVREKRGLSYDISSRMQFFRDTGMFVVTAGTDPAQATAALATTERELKRICEKRIGAAELKRTKEFLVGNFRLAHERITAKLFYYGHTMLSFGRLVNPQEQVDAVWGVTADEVQSVARAVLQPSHRALSLVTPAI